MKFQLSCIIDADMIQPVTELLAPYSRIVLKMVDATVVKATLQPPTPKPVAKLFRRSSGFGRRGIGPILGLRAVAASPDGRNVIDALRVSFKANNLKIDGAGATLSKLRSRGYVRRPDKGIWRLTPKGEALLRRKDSKEGLASVGLTPSVEADHDEG